MAKILLVEDDQANREMLARYLTLLGYRIVLALDGARACISGARRFLAFPNLYRV